jgi:hypothetical protein
MKALDAARAHLTKAQEFLEWTTRLLQTAQVVVGD